MKILKFAILALSLELSITPAIFAAPASGNYRIEASVVNQTGKNLNVSMGYGSKTQQEIAQISPGNSKQYAFYYDHAKDILSNPAPFKFFVLAADAASGSDLTKGNYCLAEGTMENKVVGKYKNKAALVPQLTYFKATQSHGCSINLGIMKDKTYDCRQLNTERETKSNCNFAIIVSD